MTIKYKTGVPQGILSKPAQAGLDKLDEAFKEYIDLVVTSTSDGKHMRNSKHYSIPCDAFDLRIWNILDLVCEGMREILGPDFDVVREHNHIHVERDVKVRK